MNKNKEPIGIPVLPGNTYTYTGPAKKMYFYDTDGNEVGEIVLISRENTFIVPENAKYFGNKIERR